MTKHNKDVYMDDRLPSLGDLAAELGAIPVSARNLPKDFSFNDVMDIKSITSAPKNGPLPIVIDIDRTLEFFNSTR